MTFPVRVMLPRLHASPNHSTVVYSLDEDILAAL